MLELAGISLQTGRRSEEHFLLRDVSFRVPQEHLCAVIGPSGCGKSTLLKVIAGVREQDAGVLRWEGRNLSEKDLDPHEIGYVPQFSIAYDLLTVHESIYTALRLRVGGLSPTERAGGTARILEDTGLGEIAERRVAVLSGGQKRRLGLALELVSSPVLLLCDEVTSGLDPKAEDEIVRLLRKLSREDARTVFSVTHSLRHIRLHDSVIVLHQGYLVYHGSPEHVFHYFNVEDPEDLYPHLATRTAEEWATLWEKHRAEYETRLIEDAEKKRGVAERARRERHFNRQGGSCSLAPCWKGVFVCCSEIGDSSRCRPRCCLDSPASS
jgi:ABC-type multidrug transport system ATPase subunit